MTRFTSVLVLLMCLSHIRPEDDLPKSADGDNESKKALFRRLFKLERTEQLAAVKSLLKIEKEDKQLKMVQVIAEKVFSVIERSRIILENSGYVPGISEFPGNEKTRDALSNILENTAFFGDILLRLPDMTEHLLLANQQWYQLYKWSIDFSNHTRLLDNKTLQLINLVSQEMNYTQRKEDFMNPYRKLSRVRGGQNPQTVEEIKNLSGTRSGGSKVKKKKKMLRGPRLSPPVLGQHLSNEL